MGLRVEVAVGAGVSVGGTGVAVGTAVCVGGTGVAADGSGVAVGGTAVSVGGTGVAVGGSVGTTAGVVDAGAAHAANRTIAAARIRKRRHKVNMVLPMKLDSSRCLPRLRGAYPEVMLEFVTHHSYTARMATIVKKPI
jgi:hypothetical protein